MQMDSPLYERGALVWDYGGVSRAGEGRDLFPLLSVSQGTCRKFSRIVVASRGRLLPAYKNQTPNNTTASSRHLPKQASFEVLTLTGSHGEAEQLKKEIDRLPRVSRATFLPASPDSTFFLLMAAPDSTVNLLMAAPDSTVNLLMAAPDFVNGRVAVNKILLMAGWPLTTFC